MGFTVMVEVGDGSGFVASRLPTKEGGKAVFAFLMGLQSYCPSHEEMEPKSWRDWFQSFQTHVDQPLCEVFAPIMDCMWGDGGGIGGEFLENEYEWYLKRNSNPAPMTESQFQDFVYRSLTRWSPLDQVMANVKLLIKVFKQNSLPEEDGLYVAIDTIPDFESLDDTLTIFKNFWYDTVRLNFS